MQPLLDILSRLGIVSIHCLTNAPFGFDLIVIDNYVYSVYTLNDKYRSFK